ncbi:GreA/GreB family elongation factor [Candidatus Saccharibacteria bacterium]|nr:GreA/GreB family elongation factor [Candidatus Saccharibacteria bacterium]
MIKKAKITNPIFLSKDGLKDLKKQIKILEHDLKRVNEELRAMDKADKRDNQLARAEKLIQIETLRSDLADKKAYSARAKLTPTKHRLEVSLGSLVELVDTITGKILRFRVVESIEANPVDGRISIDSPLGKSLLGKKEQEKVHWTVGFRDHCMLLAKIC